MGNVFCNPLNLPYTFQKKPGNDFMFREASDPTVLYWKDKYWLFASMSGGFWYSDDMNHWNFHRTDALPTTDYAPDVCVFHDKMYFLTAAPKKNCTIYGTSDPFSDQWELVSEIKSGWNPHLFADDKRIYLYWGCSTNKPICGVELDSFTFRPTSSPVELISGHPERHGFEVRGENNQRTYDSTKLKKDERPFIEGPWMTKHDGKYYLQYAAPATQYNTYGDGVYVGNSPLGVFNYQLHNPFCFKPGGFITGAGHGSTFADKYGNYWHAATMRICQNDIFERRIGIFPVDFDENGTMFCNTDFGDYPINLPESKWNPLTDSNANLNLLTYKKPISTSSRLDGTRRLHLVDEDIQTFWQAEDSDTAPWILIDLKKTCTVSALQINFADVKCTIARNIPFNYHGAPNARRDLVLASHNYEYTIEISEDGKDFYFLKKVTSPNPHEFINLNRQVSARYLLVRLRKVPFGGKFALSGVRAFGKSDVYVPDSVKNFKITRESPTSALATWSILPEAIGYNIKWGISPNKLYSSWCVYDTNKLELNCLNKSQKYYFMIEAFNEAGKSQSDVLSFAE